MAQKHLFSDQEFDEQVAEASRDLTKYSGSLMTLAQCQKEEEVLAVSCDHIDLLVQLMNAGVQLLAIDTDPAAVAAARKQEIRALIVDVHQMEYDERFDLVISDKVLSWTHEPARVMGKIYEALKPGGRLVMECAAQGSMQSMILAIEEVFANNPAYGKFFNPWQFPEVSSFQKILETQGFEVSLCKSLHVPTIVTDLEGWLERFGGEIVGHLTREQQQLFRRKVIAELNEAYYTPEQGWIADYVRLRATATKPSP